MARGIGDVFDFIGGGRLDSFEKILDFEFHQRVIEGRDGWNDDPADNDLDFGLNEFDSFGDLSDTFGEDY